MYKADGSAGGGLTSSPLSTKSEVLALPMHAQVAKRCVDLCASVFFLIAFLPLILLVAFGVGLSSRGPIIYKQWRVGRNGRPFQVYKFRSMRPDAESLLRDLLAKDPEASKEWQQFQKLKVDPRTTRFGRFIRRTSLDELPQFLNVLAGEMSLIGPRPVTASEAERYGRSWTAYCAVRPGITGMWQVNGRSSLSYERRVALDEHYVRNWSFTLDVLIMLKTVRVVLTNDGSH